ncbi:MAG TPA: hypothetical protein VFS21_07250 [Roseiflexaceae bacterium]|nr:hypothetical protein [Roseiflexaceae bacterium]
MTGLVLLCVFLAICASLISWALRRGAHRRAMAGTGQLLDQQVERPASTHTTSVMPSTAAPVAGAPRGKTQEVPVWLVRLYEATHGLILGQTRSGKTVIAHLVAMVRAEAGQRVVVCDPDALSGMWPRCEVVGTGDDFKAIEQKLQQVLAEIIARREARTERAELSAMTLVLSDAADIMEKCPTAREVFEVVLRRGAKLGISLIVDVQDDQVATLNIPGASHLLKNFTVRIEVRKENDRRLVRYDKKDYSVPGMPDPEKLADEYARAHPRVKVVPVAAVADANSSLSQKTDEADRLLSDLLDKNKAEEVVTAAAQPQPQPQPEPTATSITHGDAEKSLVLVPASTSAGADEALATVSVVMVDEPPVWTCPDNGRTATRQQVLDLLRQAMTEPAIVKQLWKIDGTAGARYKAALEAVAKVRAAALGAVEV